MRKNMEQTPSFRTSEADLDMLSLRFMNVTTDQNFEKALNKFLPE